MLCVSPGERERAVVGQLDMAGYSVQFRMLDCRNHFIPQRRKRAWFVALHRLKCNLTTVVMADAVLQNIFDTLSRLEAGNAVVNLMDFMLDDSDEIVMNELAELQRKKDVSLVRRHIALAIAISAIRANRSRF